MSFSPLIAFLLAASWVLPALIIALLYSFRTQRSSTLKSQQMNRSVDILRVDIAKLDFDARSEGWRREGWDGPETYMKAQVTEFSNEVTLPAPYADGCVSVQVVGGPSSARRRCSLCLN